MYIQQNLISCTYHMHFVLGHEDMMSTVFQVSASTLSPQIIAPISCIHMVLGKRVGAEDYS